MIVWELQSYKIKTLKSNLSRCFGKKNPSTCTFSFTCAQLNAIIVFILARSIRSHIAYQHFFTHMITIDVDKKVRYNTYMYVDDRYITTSTRSKVINEFQSNGRVSCDTTYSSLLCYFFVSVQFTMWICPVLACRIWFALQSNAALSSSEAIRSNNAALCAQMMCSVILVWCQCRSVSKIFINTIILKNSVTLDQISTVRRWQNGLFIRSVRQIFSPPV